jgi:hypothetical protein
MYPLTLSHNDNLVTILCFKHQETNIGTILLMRLFGFFQFLHTLIFNPAMILVETVLNL